MTTTKQNIDHAVAAAIEQILEAVRWGTHDTVGEAFGAWWARTTFGPRLVQRVMDGLPSAKTATSSLQRAPAVTCPGCSGDVVADESQPASYGTCRGCGGLVTLEPVDATLAYAVVRGEWAAGDVPADRQRYFDITYHTGPGLVARRHGWYDPVTGGVTQVG